MKIANDSAANSHFVGPGSRITRARLFTGLVLFAYALIHFLNHALGHVSLAAMEAALDVQELVTDSLPGQILLYTCLLVHACLGVWKLVSLKTWRLRAWEWAQLLMGLAIPWFLASHIVFTRASQQIIGANVDYEKELLLIWPGAAWQQSVLLLLVWVHGCIGIHFWLRMRRWYADWAALLAALAILVPALAQTGWISAARRHWEQVRAQAEASEAGQEALQAIYAEQRFMIDNLRPIEHGLQWILIAIAGLAALAFLAGWVRRRIKNRVRVSYGDDIVATTAPGMTLLEVSRASGIPHMSVCGGRARCSTCRTLIMDGADHLSPRTEAENLLLGRLNAGPEIRLACQSRVLGDVKVRPILKISGRGERYRQLDPLGWGVERELCVLFMDIRDFSRLSEKSLPYDIVYILNSFFDEVGAAVEERNGYIDKFMGDGMMVLFGLDDPPQTACRDAILAGIAAHKAAERASVALRQQVPEPIRIGVGLHAGQAVVGRVGKTSDQTVPSRLTAIGDTVNVAARLESATKEFDAGLIVSAATFEKAGLAIEDSFAETVQLSVHNISEPVHSAVIRDMDALEALLGRHSETAKPGRRPGRKAKTAAATS